MSKYNDMQSEPAKMLSDQNKVVSLFQFIRELNKLKQKAILNFYDYPWARTVSSLPDDPDNISVFYRDRVENEDLTEGGSILLSVHKPEFEKCPEPDSIFVTWLKSGWDSFRNDPQYIESRPRNEQGAAAVAAHNNNAQNEEQVEYEFFANDPNRIEAYNTWLRVRSEWVERQKIILQTRNLFADLYRLYFELQRDSETMELVVANGILCDKNNSNIRHPVLTKRVKINYDPAVNTVFVEEIDSQPELYSIAFQTMDDINLQAINQLQADLQNNDYHPLDRNDTPAFLKVLVHQLSSDSRFSENGIPENWKSNSRLLLYMDPVYIMRKRLDGTLKAIEQIIENVSETGYIPEPIREIVSGGKIELPEDSDEESLEEQLAAVGGESVDVLLSKEANKEQLEIAKRIESYNAVLVQGPPGTGKTHTIANLMGHFLAQGKSVLVTSQTPKALNVLKDKVAPGLQNLCVSVLEDSNIDMERSVDGITDFMSRTTSHEIKKDMDRIAQERRQVISELASVRRKIFRIINQECNCIVYNGEELSPSKAASFVLEHAEDLSYIPGRVRLDTPLPMSFAELAELYRSNELLSAEDESELTKDIPCPEAILSPAEFAHAVETAKNTEKKINELATTAQWSFDWNPADDTITFRKGNRNFTISRPELSAVSDLKSYTASFEKFEPWMTGAAVDGKNGGAFRKRWDLLIEQILKTCDYAENLLEEQFGQTVSFLTAHNMDAYMSPLRKLKDIFEQKGKLSKLTLMLNKDCVPALENVMVNGHAVQSKKDCELALHVLELNSHRTLCAGYWNDLLSGYGVPGFFELSQQNPERIAKNWIPHIQKYLDWYKNAYTTLLEKLEAVGIPANILFDYDTLDSDAVATEKKIATASGVLPEMCDVCCYILDQKHNISVLDANVHTLEKGSRAESSICHSVVKAIESRNIDAYADAFSDLGQMYRKYELQQHRREMLLRLEPVAPQWAAAIKDRDRIHGLNVVPDTIEMAWKWKQLSGIIEDLTAQPFSDLQNKSVQLSKAYRKITAQYAEKSAWYHLLRKTEGDIDMRHALQGWKQTVKKIGKGTGKNAPALKAKARELMSKCQVAVPSWIMPINQALESLNPKENCFDIIIIDEASQSDVSSLAILYMGKKLIIVGDDKQVSPMAVGVEIDKMSSLQKMYIQDKIPNSHLYDAKTSIYDIAKTTFQPLMLREHFRCVPEIIGFSNMLSYDYKIKPLRDASNSTILPAVVNYRVADGQRLNNKTNPNEAKAIVALMQACIQQPEYAGKTFGAISLLGDEQVRVMQRLIEEKIDHKDLVERNILCGNASHFQGDERDIIFLSVVDSVTADSPSPIRLQNFGPDDSIRKRYNVAASRARDQLWVVDSLDSATELKPGDIRKTLIDYSLNPGAAELRHAEIEEKADSPFEVGVAQALVDRGYRLVQQWKVGAYRLDMVAVCGKKTVAIECDGERYHSGEAKVREDMERQTILERLGWRFIRIRGSEYFRNPEKTIERVVSELSMHGIMPDGNEMLPENTSKNYELLGCVKSCAARIMSDAQEEPTVDLDTITAALDPKNAIPKTEFKPLNASADKRKDAPSQSMSGESLYKSVSSSKKMDTPIQTAKVTTKKAAAPKSAQKPQMPEQQVIPGMESLPNANMDVVEFLRQKGVSCIDKRSSSGALWILGGKELSDVVKQCRNLGVHFTFKEDGGKATKGKPGWWAK
ncbi:AAA domain-containing protein [Bacteroides helcogenes]|uniref:AAA domain-containing protein n=1 Tax=Bacteroides helcogenes TaxID=290053 RepID=UPI0008F15385|nr:AAA domain-containing protein [Bacteroides helcogenes]MDY5238004.1 AAA domain-containing protein [Bacteroides helcogenes]SFJ62318.1 AAA domain-containing protein [Ruminococcaceae bacterium D5]